MAKSGVGRMIRDARKARGWTQAELAQRLNTSPSTISNLEREMHAPTVPDQVNDLVLALGIPPEALLGAMGVRFARGALASLPVDLSTAIVRMDQRQIEGLRLLLQLGQQATPQGDGETK